MAARPKTAAGYNACVKRLGPAPAPPAYTGQTGAALMTYRRKVAAWRKALPAWEKARHKCFVVARRRSPEPERDAAGCEP